MGIFALIAVTVLIFVVYTKNQSKAPAQAENSPKIIKSVKSTVSVKTGELVIKEWKIKMPVNGNLLGSVSYRMVNDNELIFSSSELNKLDLSSAECSGVSKDSWGLRRFKVGDKPNPVAKYNYLPDYLIGHIRPKTVCSEITKIYSAFAYMQQYIERV